MPKHIHLDSILVLSYPIAKRQTTADIEVTWNIPFVNSLTLFI